MNKKEKEIIKEAWGKIKKGAIKGSGIDLGVEITPAYEIMIVVRMRRFGKWFAEGTVVKDKRLIPSIIDRLNKKALRTRGVTKKRLIELGILG